MAVWLGTENDENMVGEDSSEIVDAGGGTDTLQSGDSYNIVDGGSGNDVTVGGGTSYDVVMGGSGNDAIIEADLARSGSGDDHIMGTLYSGQSASRRRRVP